VLLPLPLPMPPSPLHLSLAVRETERRMVGIEDNLSWKAALTRRERSHYSMASGEQLALPWFAPCGSTKGILAFRNDDSLYWTVFVYWTPFFPTNILGKIIDVLFCHINPEILCLICIYFKLFPLL
jgi:hypothetical protein